MFLTLVKIKSCTTWIFLLLDKTNVPMLLKDFIVFIQKQFKTTIKAIRMDNGTEFCNNFIDSFQKSFGIIHQLSFVYTPQRNGLVERKHRHLLNCARALRFHASLPIVFWGDCVLTAVYLINRTPTSILQDKSQFEVLYHITPDYSCLPVFGSLYYATQFHSQLISLHLELLRGFLQDTHITRKVTRFSTWKLIKCSYLEMSSLLKIYFIFK